MSREEIEVQIHLELTKLYENLREYSIEERQMFQEQYLIKKLAKSRELNKEMLEALKGLFENIRQPRLYPEIADLIQKAEKELNNE
jgi:hypothetical protein